MRRPHYATTKPHYGRVSSGQSRKNLSFVVGLISLHYSSDSIASAPSAIYITEWPSSRRLTAHARVSSSTLHFRCSLSRPIRARRRQHENRVVNWPLLGSCSLLLTPNRFSLGFRFALHETCVELVIVSCPLRLTPTQSSGLLSRRRPSKTKRKKLVDASCRQQQQQPSCC